MGFKNPGEMNFGLGDFNRHVGTRIDGFEGAHGGNRIGKKSIEERRLVEFCNVNELCVANSWFQMKEQRKITSSMDRNRTGIDFGLVGKNIKRI